jgi:hypothetical protein
LKIKQSQMLALVELLHWSKAILEAAFGTGQGSSPGGFGAVVPIADISIGIEPICRI